MKNVPKDDTGICFVQLKILTRYLLLNSRGFSTSSLSTYDCSTLYTTLSHNLINEKLTDLIESTFQREGSPYLDCIGSNTFLISDDHKSFNIGLVKSL